MFFKVFILISICFFYITVKANNTCVVCDGCSYYNISFETNGGKSISNKSICLTCPDLFNYKLPIAQRDGYTFDGWYADEKLTIKINSLNGDADKIDTKEVLDNNNCPTGEILVKLYAKWDKVDIGNNQQNGKQNNIILYVISFIAFLVALFILMFSIKRNQVKPKN